MDVAATVPVLGSAAAVAAPSLWVDAFFWKIWHRSDATSNERVREMTASRTELAPLHSALAVRAENSGDQVHSCLRERANPIMNSMKSNLRRVRGPVFMPATPVADVTLPGPFWREPACDLSAYTG
ncbi:hypothetical protein MRS44_004590 [Fusarium solani]|uniref:uncharacterized protein n=1 Tax=Fusarium solani TaxID=169388 RepID=UPI0032C40E44|nr:hypothetical protein MRS44_004590 [Fusarium solani]